MLTTTISDGGFDYDDDNYTNLASTSDGSGTGATFNVVVIDGAITSVQVVNKGSGYAVGDSIEINPNDVGTSGEGLTIVVASLSVAVENDMGGFYVQINGLGLGAQIATATSSTTRLATNQFPIFNKFALANLGAPATTNSYFSRLQGGDYDGVSVACSNPMGTFVSVKVFNMADGVELADNNQLDSVITFDIELLDI